MMSKTSSNKVNPALNLFGFTLKRNAGIMALISIGFLLICPVYMLMQLKDCPSAEYRMMLSAWINAFIYGISVVGAIGVTGFNVANFSYMYKRSSSDMVDSLPVKKRSLFISKALSGYVLILIPVFLCSLSLAITALISGNTDFILRVFVNFGYSALVLLAISSFSLIFVVSASSVFDFLVSFFAVNGGLIITAVIAESLCEEFLGGYSEGFFGEMLKAVSPFIYEFGAFYTLVFTKKITVTVLSFIIKSLILILASSLFSLILFKYRKSESAGKAFAYNYMYCVCSVIISICGSYAIGTVFADGSANSLRFVLFGLIGAVLAAVTYGAITYRGFKTLKKSLILGVVAFAVLGAGVLFVKFDLTGFNTYLPEKSEIKSATVSLHDFKADYEGDFTEVLAVHKALTDDKKMLSGKNKYITANVGIEYTLKSGKTVDRNYEINLDKSKAKDEILTIAKGDARFNTLKAKLEAKKSAAYQVDFANGESDSVYGSYMTYGETKQLIDIYEKELNTKNLEPLFSSDSQMSLNIYVKDRDYAWHSFALDDKYTETLSYIKSLDLEGRVEQIEE